MHFPRVELFLLSLLFRRKPKKSFTGEVSGYAQLHIWIPKLIQNYLPQNRHLYSCVKCEFVTHKHTLVYTHSFLATAQNSERREQNPPRKPQPRLPGARNRLESRDSRHWTLLPESLCSSPSLIWIHRHPKEAIPSLRRRKGGKRGLLKRESCSTGTGQTRGNEGWVESKTKRDQERPVGLSERESWEPGTERQSSVPSSSLLSENFKSLSFECILGKENK